MSTTQTVSGKVDSMSLRSLSLLVTILASAGLLTSGCAARQPQGKFQAGFYKKMMQRQKAGMELDPDPAKNLPEMTAAEFENLGDNYLRQGNINLAFVQYNKALKLEPEKTILKYKIGKLFLQKGLPQEAIKEFQTVVQKDPDNALAYEGLGQAHFYMKNFKQAEQYLDQAIALNDQLWAAHNMLGIVYDGNQEFDAAISAYKKAIAINDKNGSIYNNLGMSYFYKGNYNDALMSFGHGLRLSNPTDQKKIYNNIGMTLVKLNKYDHAFEAFKKGSDEAKAHNNMGMIFLKQGKSREAIASFEKAIEANPSYYLKASENLKLAKMSLAKQQTQSVVAPVNLTAADQELKPLRLRLDTMLSTQIGVKP